MRPLRNCVVALFLGCCAPVLIWAGVGSAFYQQKKQVRSLAGDLADQFCSIDADCPPGYICRGGSCVPETN
jgi:hypothetical protein